MKDNKMQAYEEGKGIVYVILKLMTFFLLVTGNIGPVWKLLSV